MCDSIISSRPRRSSSLSLGLPGSAYLAERALAAERAREARLARAMQREEELAKQVSVTTFIDYFETRESVCKRDVIWALNAGSFSLY